MHSSQPQDKSPRPLSLNRVSANIWWLLGVGLLGSAGYWWSRPVENLPAAQSAQTTDAAPLQNPTRAPALRFSDAGPSWPESHLASDFPTLARQLLDPTSSLKARRRAARALSGIGTDEAIAVLRDALEKGPPYLQAAIAESLGSCTNAAAPALLANLLLAPDEIVARGAIRGIAARGGADSAATLAQILNDPGKPTSLRTEAAMALGEVNLVEAFDALKQAAETSRDPVLLESVLSGLGKRAFSETADFFTEYLASDKVEVSSKGAAVESLSEAGIDASTFLLQCLSHPSSDVRAAAAWALSSGEAAGLGPQIAAVLADEKDSNVRIRLYQALENQAGTDVLMVLPEIQKESSASARLAGLNYLAGQVRYSNLPELLGYFEQGSVPELQERALASKDLYLRLGSTVALTRAGTPAATAALQELMQKSGDRKVVQAAQAGLAASVRK